MTAINISSAIQQKCPSLQLGCLQMEVSVHPSSAELLAIIQQGTDLLATQLQIEDISQRKHIQQTRLAYKALGKKPGRYRPSAEALLRRVVTNKGLYQINNVVDILNYISVRSGFSIGGYDLDQISGSPELTIGIPNEPYAAIARGQLNVGNLPVLRDDLGAFGSPTSDSTRTSVTEHTQQFLMIFFDFGNSNNLSDWLNQTAEVFKLHADADKIETWLVAI
jgi:DNA/RNA-binding domain of Phe-tRNA-synthetase-like protein